MSTAFRVVLEGTQEVPPNNSTASGLGTVIFDSTAVAASYSFQIEGVDYGLATGGQAQTPSPLDDVISTHFHNEVRGTNGPVVFGQINPAQDNDDLEITENADGSWTVSGRWENTDPANVSIANFAADLGSAPVGSEFPLYFNVHTNHHWFALNEERRHGRQGRIGKAEGLVPPVIWLILIIGAVVVIASVALFADREETAVTQAAMIAAVAIIVVSEVVLVRFLDKPYEGKSGSIEPTAMARTLAQMEREHRERGQAVIRCTDFAG